MKVVSAQGRSEPTLPDSPLLPTEVLWALGTSPKSSIPRGLSASLDRRKEEQRSWGFLCPSADHSLQGRSCMLQGKKDHLLTLPSRSEGWQHPWVSHIVLCWQHSCSVCTATSIQGDTHKVSVSAQDYSMRHHSLTSKQLALTC